MADQQKLIEKNESEKPKWLSNKKNRTIFISIMVVLGVLILLGVGLGLYFGLRNTNGTRSPSTSSQTSGSITSGSQLSGSTTSSGIITSSSTNSITSSSIASSSATSSINPFIITRIAGQYDTISSTGDGGPPIDSTLAFPITMTFVSTLNRLYIWELE